MKKRTIRHVTTALAVLALLAGHAMTGSEVEAQNQGSNNMLQSMCQGAFGGSCTQFAPEEDSNTTECRNAWESSLAYATCSPFTAKAKSDQSCRVAANCQYVDSDTGELRYSSTSWEGSLEETGRLVNCLGYLMLDTC